MFTDVHNRAEFKNALNVTRQTNSSTAIVGNIIDTAGYDGVEFAIIVGNLTDADATVAITMEEGNASNLSDAAAVAAADRIGSLPSFAAASEDHAVKKVGYKGSKRYVRITATPTSNDAGNVDIAAIATLTGALKMPTP